MRLLLFVVANRVIRDAEQDRISVIDIIDSIAAEHFPYYIGEMSLLMVYHKEEGDSDNETVSITISNNDNELASRDQTIRFAERIGNRTVTDLNGFVLFQPGQFSIHISHKGKEIGSWSIPVALENSSSD